MKNKEYYVRAKQAGYWGNSFMWYAKNGEGYTAYINAAERFSKKDADKIVKTDPERYEVYACAEIDKRLHYIFDASDVENLGTDKPCAIPDVEYAKK